MEDVLKNIDYELDLDIDKANVAQKEKVVDDVEGDDVDKSTTKEFKKRQKKKKQLRKRKRYEKDDAAYIPSPEHVSESQSSSGGKKKVGARKRIVSPKIKKVTPKITKPKIVLKKKPSKEPSKPPTPPPEPTPHQSPIRSPSHQPSPPKQPTPPRQPSPLHLSPPPHEQPFLTSQEIFKTPPPTQIQIQLTPVKKLEKKMDDVLNENKRLAAESKKVGDREKILEMRVKKLESENKSLLKKIDADQTEIDILKVRVTELEEEKTRRDEQNKYFELKNKELEAAKALKEHKFYMMNKLIESMLGKSIEQKFEEIQDKEVRAKRQAEIEALMKDEGKNAEGSVVVAERSIVPSLVVDNPVPITSVSAVFDEDVSLEDLIGNDDEEDDEEDDDEGDDGEEDDDDEKVFSASSHGSDDDNDDDDQGGTGITVTEASNEQNVEDLMKDDANEETEEVDG
ncbi:MAP7 domain-containing protein 1-like [Helianthus annuus]|uniref:MAP7 domain-containing protein 1-like n=1 Tax=Helianthus annuus TaxID=4232 RepID=UPI000B8F2535|nr:MAP7 domain-containing protein 1-like [Helianthus annuus]